CEADGAGRLLGQVIAARSAVQRAGEVDRAAVARSGEQRVRAWIGRRIGLCPRDAGIVDRPVIRPESPTHVLQLGRRGECRQVRHVGGERPPLDAVRDRKSTRLNSSHVSISYAVFCLKKKKKKKKRTSQNNRKKQYKEDRLYPVKLQSRCIWH